MQPAARGDLAFWAWRRHTQHSTKLHQPEWETAACRGAQVQMDIRKGHAQTVEKVLTWLDAEGSLSGVTVADCGCGTGTCRWRRRWWRQPHD